MARCKRYPSASLMRYIAFNLLNIARNDTNEYEYNMGIKLREKEDVKEVTEHVFA